jgi:lipopolysaccharide transport system permease protein
MIILTLSISMWASAVNVKYRDVAAALPVLVQFWMFTSPVVYPSQIVYSQNISDFFRWLYTLNPMVGIIDNFRAAMLGSPFNWPALVTSAVVAVLLFIYAGHEFRRLETTFADMI